ncbi:SAM-dependent methyltransferase [Phytohabitans sp. LJ34]|uniref:SAM-dependent methyltransferase n=1 Tax=Phytohabitans sp. LJ34 TaxID=3452217 RepID=UPI003F887F8D
MDRRYWTAVARQRMDPEQVSQARIYDYLLGGRNSFAVDQAAAEAIIAQNPDAPLVARANRAFLRRAVQYLVGRGIRQFVDIGSGLPTVGNVHEIAQQTAPDAGVIYVDNDPVAVTYSRELLQDDARAVVVPGDLREVDLLLDRLTDPRLRPVVDLDRPFAVLLVAVLHFFPDHTGPQQLVARLREAMPPGSPLVVSHLATESFTQADVAAVQGIYRERGTGYPVTRTREQVRAFFGDFPLVDPGLVYVSQWHHADADAEPAAFAQDPARSGGHAGVAVKPSGLTT